MLTHTHKKLQTCRKNWYVYLSQIFEDMPRSRAHWIEKMLWRMIVLQFLSCIENQRRKCKGSIWNLCYRLRGQEKQAGKSLWLNTKYNEEAHSSFRRVQIVNRMVCGNKITLWGFLSCCGGLVLWCLWLHLSGVWKITLLFQRYVIPYA